MIHHIKTICNFKKKVRYWNINAISAIIKKCSILNLIENQKDIQTVINAVFNQHLFVYGVSRKDSVDYQGRYRNLLEISKLPKANTINLEFIEE